MHCNNQWANWSTQNSQQLHALLSNYNTCLLSVQRYPQYQNYAPGFVQNVPLFYPVQNNYTPPVEVQTQTEQEPVEPRLAQVDSFEQTKRLLAQDSKHYKKKFTDYSKVYQKEVEVEESEQSMSVSQIIPSYLTEKQKSPSNGSIHLILDQAERVERVEIRYITFALICSNCQAPLEMKCSKAKYLQGSAQCKRCNRNGNNKIVIQHNNRQKYPEGKQINQKHKIADFQIEGINDFKILKMELKVYCKCMSSSYKYYQWPDSKMQEFKNERVLIARERVQLHLMCYECQNEIYFTPSEMIFQGQ